MKFIIFIIFLISGRLIASDISNDPKLSQQKIECEKRTDSRWNDDLNSCVFKEEIEAISDDESDCVDQDCFTKNAEKHTGIEANDTYRDSKLDTVSQVGAGAYLVFMKIAQKVTALKGDNINGNQDFRSIGEKRPGEACASKTLFKMTSAAWVVGDLYLKYSAKSKLKKLKEEYKDESEESSGESYQSQVRAFHYLLKEQKIIEEQATMRSLLQKTVAAGYGASTALALFEMTPTGSISSCYLNSPNETSSLPPPPQIGEIKQSSYFSQFAQIGSSAQIALVSGVMTGLNLAIIKSANKEKNRSIDNQKTIQEIIDGYTQYKSGMCPDGRDKVNNSECYCFNSDGTQNQNRTNSLICQKLFSYHDIDYSKQKIEKEEKSDLVCVTVQGQVDRRCKCAEMINTRNGKTACANVSTASLLSGGFPSATAINSSIGSLNKLARGEGLTGSNLRESERKLSATSGKIKKLVSNLKSKSGLGNYPNEEYFKNYGVRLGSSIKNDDFKSIGSLSDEIKSGGLKSLIGDKIKNTLDEISNIQNEGEHGSKVEIEFLGEGKGKLLADKFKQNMDWSDSHFATRQEVLDIMNEGREREFKDSEIIKAKEKSLFEIISRRYQITGTRRLFE